MKTVRMTHPDVGESEVPASAVPHWRASGWEVAKPAEEAAEPESVAEKTPQEQSPPRRRQMKEEADGGA